MSTEKTSIENENQPSCLGAVSGWVAVTDALQNHYKLYGLQTVKDGFA